MILYIGLPGSAESEVSEIIEAFAEACQRLTPRIALRAREGVFLDLYGTRLSTPEGRARAEGVVRVLAERRWSFGSLKLGWGCDACEALARAGWRSDGASSSLDKSMSRDMLRDMPVLPIAALPAFASPFEADPDREKEAVEIAELLRMLGITRLADFARMPAASLATRFGKLAPELHRRVSGVAILPWPRFVPAERIVESVDLCRADDLSGIVALEPLLFVMREGVERVVSRLRGRLLKVSELELRFICENRTQRVLRMALPVPQGSTPGLLPLVRERLSMELQLRPLGSPATRVDLRVLETAPGGGAQRDFFDHEQDHREALDGLVGRLLQRLGAGKAFEARLVDRHRPEAAWERAVPGRSHQALTSESSKRTKVTTGINRVDSKHAQNRGADVARLRDLPPRPSRLLPRPLLLTRLDEWLCLSNRARYKWQVTHWEGPERLTGEWWSQGFQRDYYRVTVVSGERLWVFESLGEHRRWWLHGFFD